MQLQLSDMVNSDVVDQILEENDNHSMDMRYQITCELVDKVNIWRTGNQQI